MPDERILPPTRRSIAAVLSAAAAALLALAASAAGEPASAPARRQVAAVHHYANQPVLDFAAAELARFLEAMGLKVVPLRDVRGLDWVFRLQVDPKMEAGSFGVSCEPTAAGQAGSVVCRGADATCVLHAAYTALERAGMCFDVTGPVAPEAPALQDLVGWSVTVRPAVRTRSIRLHMNFPMDLSSYSLDEAKQYVRNLARLRYSEVVFHSYAGDWYNTDYDRRRVQAGRFFLGVRYEIPDREPFRKVIRNQRVFCIPEIEPFYDDPGERGRRAVGWLAAVMAEAKRAGLAVRFSIDSNVSTATCEAILRDYPMVDSIEFITSETLERADQDVSPGDLEKGMELLLRPPATQPADRPRVLMPGVFHQIAHHIRMARAAREHFAATKRAVALCVGVYCPARRLHRAAVPLMRRFVPRGIEYAVLPSYGARAVAECIRAVPMTAEDWARARPYTWLEFDGSMYLQQNAVEGVRRLIAEGRQRLAGKQIPAIGLNHWRTAENRTAFRYAAEAMLAGPVDPKAFYRRYAARLGVARPDDYAAAMIAIDDADAFVRDKLFNIGFCWAGVWGRRGLGRIGWWRRADIAVAVDALTSARARLDACLRATSRPAGRDYLAFLVNRVDCTILHLRSVDEVAALQPICLTRRPEDPEKPRTRRDDPTRKPAELTDEQRRQVRQACDRALALAQRYIALHAQAMPDRGCEGTLINYATVPPAVFRRIRREYGGEGG